TGSGALGDAAQHVGMASGNRDVLFGNSAVARGGGDRRQSVVPVVVGGRAAGGSGPTGAAARWSAVAADGDGSVLCATAGSFLVPATDAVVRVPSSRDFSAGSPNTAASSAHRQLYDGVLERARNGADTLARPGHRPLARTTLE